MCCSGKSTLLHAISTYSLPKFPTYLKITIVQQEEVRGSDDTVLSVVMSADLERTALLQEETHLQAKLKLIEGGADAAQAAKSAASPVPAGSPADAYNTAGEISDRLTAIYERLTEMESHTAVARASTILAGLQFSPEMQQMPTKALSGGEKAIKRTRVMRW